MNTPENTLLQAEIKRLQFEVRDLQEQRDILRVRLDGALSTLAELDRQEAERFNAHVETPPPPSGGGERVAVFVLLAGCLSMTGMASTLLSGGHRAWGYLFLALAGTALVTFWPMGRR